MDCVLCLESKVDIFLEHVQLVCQMPHAVEWRKTEKCKKFLRAFVLEFFMFAWFLPLIRMSSSCFGCCLVSNLKVGQECFGFKYVSKSEFSTKVQQVGLLCCRIFSLRWVAWTAWKTFWKLHFDPPSSPLFHYDPTIWIISQFGPW